MRVHGRRRRPPSPYSVPNMVCRQQIVVVVDLTLARCHILARGHVFTFKMLRVTAPE